MAGVCSDKLGEMETCLDRIRDVANEEDLLVFQKLYTRFLREPSTIAWSEMRQIDAKYELPYDSLLAFDGSEPEREILKRLVVVKLNGGLGTTMGCSGPKSLIEVRPGLSFLDFALMQNMVWNTCAHHSACVVELLVVKKLNDKYGEQVPLYLMDSFNTEAETAAALALKDSHLTKNLHQFSQNKCPRIYADSLLPVPNSEARENPEGWYPPGHGNVFESMASRGVLDRCLAEGRDIAFFSNIDNTGACVDMGIAGAMAGGIADYIMEVTQKTVTDIKGGTLIDLKGRLMHLEIPQVPDDKLDEFCSLGTFKMFNTNNIWVNLRAVKEKLESGEGITMEIIANRKTLHDGKFVIQLETSIGGAIRNFPGRSLSVVVGRHRFLPVKSTQELLALMSNAYEVDNDSFALKLSPSMKTRPIIVLSKEFSSIVDFAKRFATIPDMRLLRHLKIEGDVYFGRNVRLIGDVSIVAEQGKPLVIEDGAVINDTEFHRLSHPPCHVAMHQ